jgi:hypothetical protein
MMYKNLNDISLYLITIYKIELTKINSSIIFELNLIWYLIIANSISNINRLKLYLSL